MRNAFFISLLIVALAGCRDFSVNADNDPSSRTAKTVDVFPGQTVILSVGDSAQILSTSVSFVFDIVMEDSRCPDSVSCVQAGKATLLLKITREVSDGPSDQSQLVMIIPGQVPKPFQLNDVIQHRNLRYQLLELSPDPQAGVVTESVEYRALIRIDE